MAIFFQFHKNIKCCTPLATKTFINPKYTHFITVIHRPCHVNCTCFYLAKYRANVLLCSGRKLHHLPEQIPAGANWVFVENNLLQELCGKFPYSSNVTGINIGLNSIKQICPSFIQSIKSNRHLEEIILSSNQLSSVPQDLQQIKYTKIWLSNNPFLCNCDMLWMISWLVNSTLPSGEHLVPDYKNVTCSNGIHKGTPIYKLNRVDMGCYPDTMPTWQIALLGVVGFLLLAVGITMFVVFKRWKEVKFLLYKHFDILDKRDKDENLEGIKYDALLSYRYGLYTTIMPTRDWSSARWEN